jgi:hypothetical protein
MRPGRKTSKKGLERKELKQTRRGREKSKKGGRRKGRVQVWIMGVKQ